jgi:hypothetical protein
MLHFSSFGILIGVVFPRFMLSYNILSVQGDKGKIVEYERNNPIDKKTALCGY